MSEQRPVGYPTEPAPLPYGQSPYPVMPAQPDAVASATVITPRDSVRWGPIVAGLLITLGSFLLLSTLALAVGLQVAPRATDPDAAGATAGIVTAVIGLVSFFLGGLVAARSSAVTGGASGLLNGFLVWAVAIAFIVLLAALGLGTLFGSTGDLLAQYRALGEPGIGADTETLREQVRTGALGAFLGLALPAVAAALGGWLGARQDLVSSYIRR